MLKQKLPSESWEEYARRLDMDDIAQMNNHHIEGVRLMRDMEDAEKYKDYEDIGNKNLIIMLFYLIIILIVGVGLYLLIK